MGLYLWIGGEPESHLSPETSQGPLVSLGPRFEQPLTALEGLRGTLAIDEIQHRSNLFPIVRVLSDRRPLPARLLSDWCQPAAIARAARRNSIGVNRRQGRTPVDAATFLSRKRFAAKKVINIGAG
jgi:hypothetical protein